MASGPDLTRAVHFDLTRGAVKLDSESAVVVSAQAFVELLRSTSDETRSRIGGDVGTSMGARIQKRLGGANGVRSASLEAVVTHLSAEVALAGFGTLTLEQWGRSLVLRVNASDAIDATKLGDFFSNLAAMAVSSATGTDAFGVVLGTTDGIRVLIASRSGAARVRTWLDEGVAWGDAIARLQGGRGNA